jgi:Spy/CpxP family protein refolding chaperone
MKNWKAIAGVLLVFVLGVAAGAFGTLGVIRHRWMHRGPQAMADFVVRRLSWELRLDTTQRDQLRNIVTDSQQQMRTVHKQFQPQIEDILNHADVQVRAILRPDQQEKFDKLVAERKEKWQHRFSP